MSNRNNPSSYTKTSIYRSTTMGISLKKTVESFVSQGHIPPALQSEIMENFDDLMCELLSNGTVKDGKGILQEKLFDPNDDGNKIYDQQSIQESTRSIRPIGSAELEGSEISMYRFVDQSYEFLIKDANITFDFRNQPTAKMESSDPRIIKLKTNKLKIVALQTSDILRNKMLSKKRKERDYSTSDKRKSKS